jgi:hypothetical protein
MAAHRLTITKTDGSVRTVPITPKVIVAFEREFKCGMSSAFNPDRDPKMEHIYWLGWKAEHMAGHVVKPFDGYLDDIDKIDVEDDAAPFDVTG